MDPLNKRAPYPSHSNFHSAKGAFVLIWRFTKGVIDLGLHFIATMRQSTTIYTGIATLARRNIDATP